MKSKMSLKKFIFSFVLLPVLFFTVCSEPAVNEDSYEPPPIDVVYSNDWRYITIYFDDTSKPITINTNVTRPPAENSNRAMTRDTAQFAFDFFEVAFCYTQANGTPRVARSSWEIGKRAGITGVYRTSGGTDYSAAEAAPEKGAALLFAGRKISKMPGAVGDIQPTILGMGRIYSVDDVPGAVVTDQSLFVTFELSAITGAVNVNPSVSSFKTASFNPSSAVSAENTYVVNAIIRQRPFPLFILPGGRPGVAARYQFGIDPFNNRDWNYYGGGIIVAEPLEGEDLYSATTREVRFPAGNDRYWYPIYKMDQSTTVTMTNNRIAGLPVQNPVTFSFDTQKTNNMADSGIFTLVFRVPVYAVTGQPGTGGAPRRWYLEPGYQSYRFNIDNGIDSTGGGVFMGVEVPSGFEANAVRR